MSKSATSCAFVTLIYSCAYNIMLQTRAARWYLTEAPIFSTSHIPRYITDRVPAQ